MSTLPQRDPLKVISLGAGVQSSTMALLSACGELPPVDAAIFADTGWEPEAVYRHLDKLTGALPFPVYRVSAGNLRVHAVANTTVRSARPYAVIPWHTSKGIGKRQCTSNFKIEPLARRQRALMKAAGAKRCEIWIGISLDEAIRMKPARKGWQTNRWPLIELKMTRRDCEQWLLAHGWSAPKSSCIGCPYKSDAQWRRLREESPEEWADAVAVDAAIRHQRKTPQFMHPSLRPLGEVDLRTPADWGQLDLFVNECEGMCGV